MSLPKLIVLLGPTASGKTAWGISLAKKYNGEIVSADSRQIYKKMMIGTGREPGEWRAYDKDHEAYYIEDVPHFLLDIVDPGHFFTLTEFYDEAVQKIRLIQARGKVPLLVGGTGLYISAIVNNLRVPAVPPNKKLRESLEEKSHDELIALLEKMDPESARRIDKQNKRRIIRALEVCIMTGELFSKQRKKGEVLFDILQIGISVPRETLYERIDRRIDQMVAGGLYQEVEALRHQKYAWELSSMSGIGYRQWKAYTEGTATLEETVAIFKRDTRHYARRQMTWFRRDPAIVWCEVLGEAEKNIETFLAS